MTNDIERLISNRMIALLEASETLDGIPKIGPDSNIDVDAPLIQVQAGVAGPIPGFEGSNTESGAFVVSVMLTAVVSRVDSPDGTLHDITGNVRDILLAESRAGLTTLNHTYASGNKLKVWHMGIDADARAQDSEKGFDFRTFNLTLYAAAIKSGD